MNFVIFRRCDINFTEVQSIFYFIYLFVYLFIYLFIYLFSRAPVYASLGVRQVTGPMSGTVCLVSMATQPHSNSSTAATPTLLCGELRGGAHQTEVG